MSAPAIPKAPMNAANILKPALARGDIQVIGATTLKEYRKYIEKDAALERRFQPVYIGEPSVAETTEILKGIRSYYETFHGVTVVRRDVPPRRRDERTLYHRPFSAG